VGRTHVEFIHAADVPLERVESGPLAGAGRRLLSSDDETGASTSLVTLPAGWRGEFDPGRPVELFVLRGRLELDARALGPAFYAYVPSGAAEAGLAASEETLALLMVEDPRPPTDEPVEIIDTTPLEFSPLRVEAPAGLAWKPLRTDPLTGDGTWLTGVPPGWRAEQVEHHPIVEEVYVLRGDLFLGPPGEMTPGCYFWRPPWIKHGPMVSQNGFYTFSRSKGGQLEVEWWDEEGAPEMLAAYLADKPAADLPRL
jgi:hypothetical protein